MARRRRLLTVLLTRTRSLAPGIKPQAVAATLKAVAELLAPRALKVQKALATTMETEDMSISSQSLVAD